MMADVRRTSVPDGAVALWALGLSGFLIKGPTAR